PTFAGAIANNDAGATAGYLVVAGGTFFAASEISRRMLVTKPQTDLSFNMGHNGALAGWATAHLLHADDRPQAAGAFIGGLTGAALGLHFGDGMTEADAVGAAFGSDIGALIGYGAAETIRGSSGCVQRSDGTFDCGGLISDLGVLYPRNASYSVTPGDIQTLWPSAAIGASAASLFLSDDPTTSHVALAVT